MVHINLSLNTIQSEKIEAYPNDDVFSGILYLGGLDLLTVFTLNYFQQLTQRNINGLQIYYDNDNLGHGQS